MPIPNVSVYSALGNVLDRSGRDLVEIWFCQNEIWGSGKEIQIFRTPGLSLLLQNSVSVCLQAVTVFIIYASDNGFQSFGVV